MSAWQAIESAPKDVPILVLTKTGEVDVAVWSHTPAHYGNNGRGDVVFFKEWNWWGNPHTNGYESEWDFSSDGSDLTHWMPLPEAP